MCLDVCLFVFNEIDLIRLICDKVLLSMTIEIYFKKQVYIDQNSQLCMMDTMGLIGQEE